MSLWHPILRAIGDMLKSDYDPDADGIIEPPQVDDATKVKGEASGLREEHGSQSIAGAGAQVDATWDTSGAINVTISYATAFSVTPILLEGVEIHEAGVVFARVPTTTSFTGVNKNFSTKSGVAYTLNWTVIGS